MYIYNISHPLGTQGSLHVYTRCRVRQCLVSTWLQYTLLAIVACYTRLIIEFSEVLQDTTRHTCDTTDCSKSATCRLYQPQHIRYLCCVPTPSQLFNDVSLAYLHSSAQLSCDANCHVTRLFLYSNSIIIIILIVIILCLRFYCSFSAVVLHCLKVYAFVDTATIWYACGKRFLAVRIWGECGETERQSVSLATILHRSFHLSFILCVLLCVLSLWVPT